MTAYQVIPGHENPRKTRAIFGGYLFTSRIPNFSQIKWRYRKSFIEVQNPDKTQSKESNLAVSTAPENNENVTHTSKNIDEMLMVLGLLTPLNSQSATLSYVLASIRVT